MTIETEQDTYRRTVAELDAERSVQEQRRHRLPCAECGCPEGLVGWHYKIILEYIRDYRALPRIFYKTRDYDADKLYTACPFCKAADTEVLNKTHVITNAGELAEWLFQRQYGYISPRDCRDLCKLAAKIEREWYDDDTASVDFDALAEVAREAGEAGQ